MGNCSSIGSCQTQAGEIKVKASVVYNGVHTPAPAEITIQTVKAPHPLVAAPNELKLLQNQSKNSKSLMPLNKVSQEAQQQSRLKLKEVEKQQSDFE